MKKIKVNNLPGQGRKFYISLISKISKPNSRNLSPSSKKSDSPSPAKNNSPTAKISSLMVNLQKEISNMDDLLKNYAIEIKSIKEQLK